MCRLNTNWHSFKRKLRIWGIENDAIRKSKTSESSAHRTVVNVTKRLPKEWFCNEAPYFLEILSGHPLLCSSLLSLCLALFLSPSRSRSLFEYTLTCIPTQTRKLSLSPCARVVSHISRLEGRALPTPSIVLLHSHRTLSLISLYGQNNKIIILHDFPLLPWSH